VSASVDGSRLLLGEAKWSARPFGGIALEREARALAARAAPLLSASHLRLDPVRALFVPEIEVGARREAEGVLIVSCSDLFP
jgi:hypothetical protein